MKEAPEQTFCQQRLVSVLKMHLKSHAVIENQQIVNLLIFPNLVLAWNSRHKSVLMLVFLMLTMSFAGCLGDQNISSAQPVEDLQVRRGQSMFKALFTRRNLRYTVSIFANG